MRLVKQSFLYFKEGNSDKVYEIDLCDTGNEKYVVNFRYGRRGSVLKEGSKTPVPVLLAEAEKIFDAVETEKISKGYTTSETGVSSIPAKAAFVLESKNSIDNTWALLPAGREKAILQRLYNAHTGNSAAEKFSWKLSRVIWKAGEYKINAAAPLIIGLFNKGNLLHQYCCTWALARTAGSDATAQEALHTIFQSHSSAFINKIAGAGLVKVLAGDKKQAHLVNYINRLPDAIKNVVASENQEELYKLLQERISQQQPDYNWLEDLYILSLDKKWVRNNVRKILQEIPFRPNYFKHVRAIFKTAEMLDDFEITGLLACRFEREAEMFRHSLSMATAASDEIYIPGIEAWVKPQKEFKKSSSRIAYSQKTKWYLHKRVLRKLRVAGKLEDTAYVQLATAILINYRHKQDFREHYSTYNYIWNRNNYERRETRFLQNAHAVFMHYILSGNNNQIALQSNHLWRIRSNESNVKPSGNASSQAPAGDGLGGLLKKITGFFSKKKENDSNQPLQDNTIQEQPAVNKNGTPYLHLWNKVPKAYIQLLMDAEMEEVHQFAEENLTAHPDFTAIKNLLGKEEVKKLLLSGFSIPARFGLTLAEEKYGHSIPDHDLVSALLNSINEAAREKGRQWAEAYRTTLLKESDFITAIIFARDAVTRSWATLFLQNNGLAADVKKPVVGKSIARLMSCREQTAETESLIKDAGTTLFLLFPGELKQVSMPVIADLLQHEYPLVLLFGLQLLKNEREAINVNLLPKEFVCSLLNHNHASVREEGIAFLQSMSDETLSKYADDIIGHCLSVYENVRRGLAPVIKRMAINNNAFGTKAAEMLMPLLLRKETAEGVHADTSRLLCNELSDYLHNANKETALNLLYSNYSAAQNVGVVILEKYTQPGQLTIPQVIALGGHENLVVREWCWKFYNEQASRIKYEKDSSIKLLDSKWQDTRGFALQFFREQFAENDWEPVTLITLADSVKPDVEAFGRELITKFFHSANGVEYLLKLSQHPSEKMQLFATNYLEQYAGNDIEKIRSLDFYFRSVLTRVNKSRIAKNRIYHFLLQEGRKTEAAAGVVAAILSDVSATAAIGDKAKCIDILLQLKNLYAVNSPVITKEIPVKMA
jgi:hypothetical protein